MNEIRGAFLESARATRDLMGRREVAEHWDRPSALRLMTVQDLCGHIVRALEGPLRYCALPPPEEPPIRGPEYYVRVLPSSAIDHPVNRDVRERAAETGAGTHTEVVERFETRLSEVAELMTSEPADRVVRVFDGVPLTLDDYVVTRIVEIVVHTDDLAVSVGLGSAAPATASAWIAIHHLVEVAALRHGELAVLRALSRRERDDVQALRVF